MTTPSQNNPIHNLPATTNANQGLAIAKQLEADAQFILEGFIGQVLIAFGGIVIAGVKPFAALSALGQALVAQANAAYVNANTAQTTADTANTTANTAQGNWTSLFSALPGVSNIADFVAFIEAAGGDLAGVVEGLFGITPGADPSADLTALGSQLMSLLGNPNFGTGGGFDLFGSAEQMLENVLTPGGGALTSSTQVPQHLLGNLNIGQWLTLPGFTSPVYNLQPDPEMQNPNALKGGGIWTYDATKSHGTVAGAASYLVTAAAVIRQGLFVPIPTKPGQVTDLGIWTEWSGVTSSAGHSICLIASAYDADDNLISDPSNRVVAAIDHAPASSTSYSGTDPVTGNTLAADAHGWVHLVGTYLAPAGCVNVRLTVEVESTVSAGNVWFSSVVQSLRDGLVDSNLLTNFENFSGQWLPTNVQGFSGLTDMVNTFQHMIDGLGSAYSTTGSVSGIDFTDLFTSAQTQTQSSLTALEKSIQNTLALGQRTNKPTSAGPNPTSEAMLSVGHFSSGGSVTTTSLAAGNAIGQNFRPSEVATKGFAEFLANASAVTNIVVNVYDVDASTGNKTLLWNSADIHTSIPTSLGYVRALIPGTSQPTVNPGDNILLEVANAGTGALTIATKATGIPNHPTEFPKNIGTTRVLASTGGTSPSSLTDSQVTYSGTAPYFSFGIADVPADYHAPQKNDYTTAGTFTLVVPSFLAAGDTIDTAGIGGGGGGGSSLFFVGGNGGVAAVWGTNSLVVGTDVKLGSTLTIVVGDRGATGGSSSAGGPGGSTTLTYVDPSNTSHTLTYTGGSGGAYGGGGSQTGQGAGNETVDGITYFGGAAVGAGSTGQSPGGGGGGAIAYLNGTSGGVGQLSLYCQQTL